MWVEIAVWICVPVLGAVIAQRAGWPVVPVMAIVTGGAIVVLALSGILAAYLAPRAIDTGYHDTYYVVAVNHYLLQNGILLLFVALPLTLIARFLASPAHLATAFFVMLHVGMGLTLLPQRVIAATSGLPRRYTEAGEFFVLLNHLSRVGGTMAFIALCGIAIATLVALYRMWQRRRTS